MLMMNSALLILAAYALGAIPSSYILGKALRGIDLRQHGSGNLGFSNAFRVLGPAIGVPVLIFDIAKGFIPAYFFPHAFFDGSAPPLAPRDFGLLCGVAAIVGHMFPVYLRFKGGKGVATSMGVYLALAPKALLLTLAIALPVMLATHFVALGSLTGAVFLPIFIALFYGDMLALLLLTILLSCLVIYVHRSNIRRLLSRTEHRFY
jgi:glycerol-3-phosphate acyltransferase PlsY